MKAHRLKTDIGHFRNVVSGKKPFEVRKNDRNYLEGDVLVLEEYSPTWHKYTGRAWTAIITCVLIGGQYGIQDGYCVLGIRQPNDEELEPAFYDPEDDYTPKQFSGKNDTITEKPTSTPVVDKAVIDATIEGLNKIDKDRLVSIGSELMKAIDITKRLCYPTNLDQVSRDANAVLQKLMCCHVKVFDMLPDEIKMNIDGAAVNLNDIDPEFSVTIKPPTEEKKTSAALEKLYAISLEMHTIVGYSSCIEGCILTGNTDKAIDAVRKVSEVANKCRDDIAGIAMNIEN